MNINTSVPSLFPTKFQEDSRVTSMRDAMGIEKVEDTRYVDANGVVRGYTKVRSKGGKEELLADAAEMSEKMQEMAAKRLEKQTEEAERLEKRQDEDVLTVAVSAAARDEAEAAGQVVDVKA